MYWAIYALIPSTVSRCAPRKRSLLSAGIGLSSLASIHGNRMCLRSRSPRYKIFATVGVPGRGVSPFSHYTLLPLASPEPLRAQTHPCLTLADPEWSAVLIQRGVEPRLEEILKHARRWADEQMVRYASGTLKNLIESAKASGGPMPALSEEAWAAVQEREVAHFVQVTSATSHAMQWHSGPQLHLTHPLDTPFASHRCSTPTSTPHPALPPHTRPSHPACRFSARGEQGDRSPEQCECCARNARRGGARHRTAQGSERGSQRGR